MIDPKYIVEHFEEAQERIRRRDSSIDLSDIKKAYLERKRYVSELDELRTKRNRLSKNYSLTNNPNILEQVREIKSQIREFESNLQILEKDLYENLSLLPNIPHPTIPVNEKIIVRENGKRRFNFDPKDHITLCKELGLVDFDRGIKISSQKFVVYTDFGAELEQALQNYFLDYVKNKDFSVILPPLLANEKVIYVAGQLPKFKDQVYKTNDGLYLIPTVEVSLVALRMDEILNLEDLPLKYTALTPNFRREAGAAGKRDKGLIRLHQYSAVEMVIFDTPEHSHDSLEEMINIAEDIVKELGLPYRISLLPAWDLAQQSAKTYDIEVYLPSQDQYYEVSSCSNCEEYQARRGNIKFRDKNKKTRYVHTLNGTALATSRVFPAILENHQQKDGSVIIPEKLREYINLEVIEPR